MYYKIRFILFLFRNSKRWDFGDFGDWASDLGDDIADGAKTAFHKTKSGLSEAGDTIGDAFDDLFGKKK